MGLLIAAYTLVRALPVFVANRPDWVGRPISIELEFLSVRGRHRSSYVPSLSLPAQAGHRCSGCHAARTFACLRRLSRLIESVSRLRGTSKADIPPYFGFLPP
ncbi:hypothetical protein, partial [Paenibacillus taiwanensis]|uniref:hypothetical protein n=1 Tax=Paenibacillus taiwanensis TaxID=401638 RepID=UPI00146BE2B0